MVQSFLTVIFLLAAALSLAIATDERWRQIGRLGWFLCMILVIAMDVVWANQKQPPVFGLDREGGTMHNEKPNPFGDVDFRCVTERGKYIGGVCFGMQSKLWYANSIDASAHQGEKLARPLILHVQHGIH